MSLAMGRNTHDESPLGYDAEDRGSFASSSSSLGESPTARQETRAYRAQSRTPPMRGSTLGPGIGAETLSATTTTTTFTTPTTMVGGSVMPTKKVNPLYGTEGEDGDVAAAGREEDDGEHNGVSADADNSGGGTLPTLADLAAVNSSSLISSHGTSFCNSLVVSQADWQESERMPVMDPRHTLTHKASDSLIASLPALQNPDNTTAMEKVEDQKEKTTGAATAAPAGTGSRVDSAHPAATPTTSSQSGEASLVAHSSTSTESRQRRGSTSPASDVRTLHDLLLWRSHLSESQHSLDPHNDLESGNGGPAGSPLMSRSACAPCAVGRDAVGAAAAAFPASTPVTPGLWTPAPVSCRPHFHAPASLPSLTNPASPSALSTTAHPDTTHHEHSGRSSALHGISVSGGAAGGGQEGLHLDSRSTSRSSALSPVSTHPPGLPPQRLASNYYASRSDLGDSFTSSSAATSHLASPAQAMPNLSAPATTTTTTTTTTTHASYFSPTDSHPPRSGRELGVHHHIISSPLLVTPVAARAPTTAAMAVSTTTAAGVQDTRRASQSVLSAEASGAVKVPKIVHPVATPSSPSENSSAVWGVEDYAPPHSRCSGVANFPHMSPARHHIASHNSELFTSPRSALPYVYSRTASQEVVYGSPVSHGQAVRSGDNSGHGSQAGTVAHIHRHNSAALSPQTPPPPPSASASSSSPSQTTCPTPWQHHLKKTVHAAPKSWREMSSMEEYPAFATPVDEDTNKAVIAFVTGLLLLFCLGFIFAF